MLQKKKMKTFDHRQRLENSPKNQTEIWLKKKCSKQKFAKRSIKTQNQQKENRWKRW